MLPDVFDAHDEIPTSMTRLLPVLGFGVARRVRITTLMLRMQEGLRFCRIKTPRHLIGHAHPIVAQQAAHESLRLSGVRARWQSWHV